MSRTICKTLMFFVFYKIAVEINSGKNDSACGMHKQSLR